MGTLYLIACLGCFGPLIVGMARRFARTPESISTPAWLLATNALFILGGPVSFSIIYGDDLTGSVRGAMTVAAVILAYSIALALTYMAVSTAVGRAMGSRVVSAVAILKRAGDVAKPGEVLVWSAFVIAVQAVSLFAYSLGLSGGTMAFDYKLNVPYAVIVLYMLFGQATLGIAALLAKLAFGSTSSVARAAAVMLLIVEYVLTFYSGRRELIWLTLAVAFGIIWSGRRRWVIAIPFAVALIYGVIFVFAPVFLRARILYSGSNAPSVLDSYRIAFEERAGDVVGETDVEAQKNTSWRFRTYSFWEQLYEERGPGFTEGKILAQAALMTLPRVIFGFSKFALGIVDENLLEAKYDICNNVGLESYVDIGNLGPVVYGVVFGTVFALADALIAFAGMRYRMLAILAAGVIMRSLFGPEANPIGYFSELRSCLIFALLAALIAMVFGPKPLRPITPSGKAEPLLPATRRPGVRRVPQSVPLPAARV